MTGEKREDIIALQNHESLPTKPVPGGTESVSISADELFARALIGQCKRVILQQQRMIDDIRRQYGLKSE